MTALQEFYKGYLNTCIIDTATSLARTRPNCSLRIGYPQAVGRQLQTHTRCRVHNTRFPARLPTHQSVPPAFVTVFLVSVPQRYDYEV